MRGHRIRTDVVVAQRKKFALRIAKEISLEHQQKVVIGEMRLSKGSRGPASCSTIARSRACTTSSGQLVRMVSSCGHVGSVPRVMELPLLGLNPSAFPAVQ